MSKKTPASTPATASTDELNPSLDAMLSNLAMARKGGMPRQGGNHKRSAVA